MKTLISLPSAPARRRSGIANGSDLPPEFLSAIYDNIVATPISLREDDDKRSRMPVGGAPVDERQRRALQAAERAEIVQAGQAAIATQRRAAKAAAAAAAADDTAAAATG